MGFTDRFREHQEKREQAFLYPGGSEADEAMEEIAEEDHYGLREGNTEE